MPKQAASAKSTKVSRLEEAIREQRDKLGQLRPNSCYPLLLSNTSIDGHVVDDVYDDLRRNYGVGCDRLDVIVDSGGGDIDAAYNLAQLFRRYGRQRLVFIVPRWAKSAATLLVCGGDSVLMTPVAELGPVDPQITEMNPLERRLEQFSPLHIESTLELIRDEYKAGNKQLADGLMQRLQFPLTLGSYKKSMELGKQYLIKLLSTRMLGGKTHQEVEAVAKRLTEGYADHGFCINLQEAQAIGLEAQELSTEELDIVWEIHRLTRQKSEVERERRRREIEKRIKEIPPELIEKLPSDLFRRPEKQDTASS